MAVATPPVWSDPSNTSVDVATGGIWTQTAIDALCSDLAALGGKDGASGYAQAHNLLDNGGFEVWQSGISFVGLTSNAYCADRWQWVAGAGSTINAAQETANIQRPGLAALGCTYTHAVQSQFVQRVENGTGYAGTPVALSMWVKTGTANAVAIAINDGTQVFTSATHPGDSLYHQLTISGTLATGASQLAVQIMLTASCTFYVDDAMLSTGLMPPPFSPLPYGDDLRRCQRYLEIIGDPASGSLIIQGYQAASGLIAAMVPFKVSKAVTPTVTKNGTWAITNCSQPVVSSVDKWGCFIQTTATATGSVLCTSTGAQSNLTAQANI